MTAAPYDAFAAAYAKENETGLFNAWYERPEILRMAGDVTDLRVLDAGCGHGALMGELRDRGALVSGFDLSPVMIDLARRRLGEDVDLRVADLAEPLPYPDGVFDLVTISLALHYVQDWAPTLADIRRVLRPGGRVLVSVLHPFIYLHEHADQSYFSLTRYTEEHEFDDTPAALSYWHRPLQDVIGHLLEAGLVLTEITEPAAVPETPTEILPPQGYRFLCFLFLGLQSP